jgi:hypothetical protein
VPGDGKLDRHDRELAFAVAEDLTAQRRFLDALGDDRDRGLGHLAQRLRDRRRAQQRDAGQRRGRQPLPRVPADQLFQAGRLVHVF